ncbi:GmrSD restriction endonuclease domain-containing protein [Phycicoccus avicenniae]|uniref:GmrSD restriction endonuclease domain-containing protein n=1 Tax=Phycicoccus avicenniae TaxID=2828860 RepID=UPI003D298188
MGNNAPAGWYPTEAGQRYWDGQRWTEHVVPAPPVYVSPARPTSSAEGRRPQRATRRMGPAAWAGWGGLAFTAALGAASSGLSGLFILTSVYAVLVALVGLARGHVSWARLRGRAQAGAALAGAIVLAGVGGATADTSPPTPSAAGPSATPSATVTSTVPTPTATATPTPTPTPSATSPSPSPSPMPAQTKPAAGRGTALAALAALSVKGRAPKTSYDRSNFGQAWADVDGNGCDTRNDILRRDLRNFTLKAGTNGCLVLSGALREPYTGKDMRFVRGQGTSSAVQIDHVVALSDAWQKGAQKMDATTRARFANDPLNLLAVHGPTNQSKSDGDAATWLPPNKSYRCAYVARQIAVKAKYKLWVTAAEHDAIERILTTCPTQKLPSSNAVALGGGRVVTPPAPAPKPKKTTPPPTRVTDPRFDTCKAANAAGYGPYYSGRDPEYDWYQDRDHDGVVCET